jgi:hypothetical protein
MNSDRVANWGMRGERAPKTASLTYKSYCDTITTEILNWNQSSEFAKMRLCCMIYPAKKPRVYVRSGVQPRQDRAVQFFRQFRDGTEPPAKNRTAGGLPGPVANTM